MDMPLLVLQNLFFHIIIPYFVTKVKSLFLFFCAIPASFFAECDDFGCFLKFYNFFLKNLLTNMVGGCKLYAEVGRYQPANTIIRSHLR